MDANNKLCIIVGAVSLQCEVCGREIIGKPHRVIIEGAKMITCSECAKLGSDYWTPEPRTLKPKTPTRKVFKSTAKVSSLRRRSSVAPTSIYEGMEVVEGYGLIVKRARESLGLTPEDLGKRIGEKESVIKKIESEKIMPDIRLATKLEHALRIKLLTKVSEAEEKIPITTKPTRTITLGEIVHLKSGKRRKRENESDNSLP